MRFYLSYLFIYLFSVPKQRDDQVRNDTSLCSLFVVFLLWLSNHLGTYIQINCIRGFANQLFCLNFSPVQSSMCFSTTYPKEPSSQGSSSQRSLRSSYPFADILVCASLMQICMKDTTSGTQTMIDHQQF